MRKVAIILTAFISTLASGQTHYPLGNMFGVNTYSWSIDSVTYPAKYKAFVDAGFTFIRPYVDVYAVKDINGGFALNPDLRGFWLDSSLHGLKRDIPGLKIILCYQNQSRTIQPTWPQGSTIDRPYNLSPDDTASYSELRRDAYALASRGGTNKNVPDYPLYNSPYWWEPRQVMYKGAAIYDFVEGMNEPDMEYTFMKLTGAQVAVANSAFYDGAKAADPNIKISSSGIADQGVAKFDSIASWCVRNRGGKLPFNYYQYHSYSFGWNFGMAGAIPVEYEGLKNCEEIVSHAAKFNTPVIVGEYGIDKANRSYLAAPKYSLGQYDNEHSQAIHTLRNALCFSRAGAYAAIYFADFYAYNLNANDSNENLFASTAFFKDVNQDNKTIVRRLNCEYLKQMKDKFGEYSFSSADRDDTVKVWNFTYGAQNLKIAWTYEILKSWNDNGTTRPLLIERKVPYLFPAGTFYKYDSTGILVPEHRTAGNYTLCSVPVYFVADNAAPLPLKLISFTAQKFDRSVILKYVVQDAAKVEVERSTDGRNWTNLGEGILNKLVDMNPAYGRNYYRLKMYEADGSFSYSFILSAFFAGVHSKLFVFNVAGQLMKKGWSEDADKFKGQLPVGSYYFRYDSFTEPFIKR